MAENMIDADVSNHAPDCEDIDELPSLLSDSDGELADDFPSTTCTSTFRISATDYGELCIQVAP